GVTGDVREIGLFATTIDTVDNLCVVVGNNKILSDNIINYTRNPFRRVDLKAQLAHGVDPREAADRLMDRIKAIPNVIDALSPALRSWSSIWPGLSLPSGPSATTRTTGRSSSTPTKPYRRSAQPRAIRHHRQTRSSTTNPWRHKHPRAADGKKLKRGSRRPA
ncbi:MAG TPA: mechanosensitive ion channel family protein, partial [Syntrophorhabdaceae bacterium]|nr:mechanosensitive ion channel family protein [Syntrophorhabdaceae bacterium]